MLPKRVKKRISLQGLLGAIAAVLLEILLTVLSFCLYFLVKPRNAAVTVLCAVDFLYAICHLIWLLKPETTHWALKGVLWSLGYLAAFIAVASLLSLFIGAFAFLKSHFTEIVVFAFFTSPSMLVVVALFILFLCYGG